MAKIKVKFRPSTIKGKKGTVYYSVSHKSIVKHITTSMHIHPENWDTQNQCIKYLDSETELIQNKIDSDISALQRIIEEFENRNIDFKVADIISQFNNPAPNVSVISFINEQILFLKDCKRFGTARNYQIAADALAVFLDGRPLFFSEINSNFVELYSDYLLHKGLVRNSLSFHMRILRAVYNKAVRLGYTHQTFPFHNTYTGIDKTKKRALNEEVITKIIELDLDNKKSLAFARDMFLFSFFTRGMAYVDIAHLKKTNIHDNTIHYTRHKTGQYMTVRIEPCIKEIIDRYAASVSGSPYVFPILDSEDIKVSFDQYNIALRLYNHRLKKISELLGINYNISSYTSRHSWATAARNQNIPISLISAGMGHTSVKTTEIYLNSIENTLIDNANKEILNIFQRTYS